MNKSQLSKKLWRYSEQSYQPYYDFWEAQLAQLETSFIFQEPGIRNSNQDQKQVYKYSLDTTVSQIIGKIAKNNDLGIYVVITSGIAYLLSRYTGRQTVLIDSPLFKANLPNETVVDRVTLITQINEQESLKSYISQFSQIVSKSYNYQNFPYHELLPISAENDKLKTNVMVWLPQIHQSYSFEKYDWSIEIFTEPTLGLLLRYNCEYFNSSFVRNFAQHLQNLFLDYVNREIRLADVEILSQDEKKQLLGDWAVAESNVKYQPQTIHQVFEAQVLRNPQHIAIQTATTSLTYSELNDKANQLAHHFRQHYNLQPNEPIGVVLDCSEYLIIALLAILKAGGTYVPIDLNSPTDRLGFIVRDADVRVLLTEMSSLTNLQNVLNIPMFVMDTQLDILNTANSSFSFFTQPSDLAYILYTSGSTGKPKGVMVEHQSFVNMIKAQIDGFDIQATDRVLQFANASFDASLSEIFMALFSGATLVLIDKAILEDGQQFLTYINKQKVTVITFPPAYLRALKQTKFPYLRVIITAGEAAHPEDAWYYAKQLNYFNAYGLTETAVCATYYQVEANSEPLSIVPIGKPIPNTSVYLLDDLLRPVPVGVVGEICVAGKGIARGYLHNQDLTIAKFIENPFIPGERLYRTGDYGKRLPSGDLIFLGRQDNLVKIRGYRIELGEIETALSSHSQVQQAVVVAQPDQQGNKRLIGYIVPKQEVPNIQELRNFLKEKLPAYMVPSVFMMLETLPLTPNGKLDRCALPFPDWQPNTVSFAAARTPVEEKLVSIWQQVLGIKQVGIEDNFFELGGDSIISIQVVSKANQEGIYLTPRQLFQYQTIRELATVANTASTTQAAQGLVEGEVPLTPIQHWLRAQNLPNYHHFNQSVLLKVPTDVKPELLEQVVSQLLRHHDALRLQFVNTESGWQQINRGVQKLTPFQVVDLSALPTEEQSTQLEVIANQLQASLNIHSGELIRVVLFKLGASATGRLLIIIHHLAVDGISWRILLEDLYTAYQQLEGGQKIQLPAKTTSWQQWAQQLQNYAQSTTLETEWEYWLSHNWKSVNALPVDNPIGRDANTVASAASVTRSLSREQTQMLLQEVPKAYNTQINDVLLTALLQAFADCTGERTLLVNLEGHGREELFEDVDISRTVGWFTTIFPVLLHLKEVKHPGETLKSVKEQLRQVPRRGIGYGILRYLSSDKARQMQLQVLPPAEVSFNYLGQSDQILPQSTSWQLASEFQGAEHSLLNQRSHLLDVICLVVDAQLQVSWTYSKNVYHHTTIEHWAENFIQRLQALIAHCRSPQAMGYTPSDFPEAQLTQQQLDTLTAQHQKNIEAIYPLSPMQQGMLFHTLYAPESGVYFEQFSYILDGPLNVAVFRQAWQQVVQRHPVLRTFFLWEGQTQPLQVVCKQVQLPWFDLDWQDLSAAQQQQQLEDFLATDRQQGFALDKAPLIRCTLIQRADDSYEFVWSTHHLLMDGWCLPIIVKEVLAFYDALNHGQSLHLPTPRPYKDYIIWLQNQEKSQAEAFWRQTLAGITAPTSLGIGQLVKHNVHPSTIYEQVNWHLSPKLTTALQLLAQQHHLTLNNLVQGAWAILLSRYSGESDVVFGVTVSGRPPDLSGVESMVGLFINSLPLRVQLPDESPVLPWLQQLQAQQMELQQYSNNSLVDIQQWSEIPAELPLFEISVGFENYPQDATLQISSFNSIKISNVRAFELTNYPLTVLVEPGEKLSVQITYDTYRFNADAIHQMLGHFQTVLESFVTDLQQPLRQVSVLSEYERQQLLVEWNNTETPYPSDKCLHQLFEEQVEKTPNAMAVVYEQQRLTYRELNARANQLAHYLQSVGVKPETLVGICVERSPEMLVGLLGILKAGGAYVPLDPSYPSDRLNYMVHDAQVCVLLTQSKWQTHFTENHSQIICLDTDWRSIANYPQQNCHSGVTAENLAYVIYTSGSTGQPKGVMIVHSGMVNYLSWCTKTYKVADGEGSTVNSSIGFDATITSLFSPLLVGRQVVLLPEAEEIEALKTALCSGRQYSLVKITPAHLEILSHLLADKEVEIQTQALIIGGEALSEKVTSFWQRRVSTTRLINEYGPTETVVGCCIYEVEDKTFPGGNIPIGHPIANTQLYILDNYLQPVPVGVVGELYIGGAGAARGYLNRPELTAERFIPNPFSNPVKQNSKLYKTGDLARYLPDGKIEYLGRIDNQVKIRGFRIELGEIEAVLNTHPQVRQAVAIVRQDNPDNKQLVAYIVPEQQPPTTQQLRDFLQRKVPDYMVPNAFVTLETLPLTPNGKLDRKALPSLSTAQSDLKKTFIAPRTPEEKVLGKIWMQVLGLEKISIYDNFVELGGDSILAILVVSQANQAGLQLTLKQLFQHPTIAKLATIANKREILQVEQSIVTGSVPLTPIQHWFLSQQQPEPHHYNQSVLLEVPSGYQPELLKQVLQKLLEHHDALRSRFTYSDSNWQQVNVAPDQTVPLTVLNLADMPLQEQQVFIESKATELQTSLNLSHGPLIRAALFQLGSDRPGRLLLIIHHLVVDGVSWRILLEDLINSYYQLSRGETIKLPPKTTSFKQWAEQLTTYSQSEALSTEFDYWLKQPHTEFVSLPVDHLTEKESNTVASIDQVFVSLNQEQTQALLQKVPPIYNTQINDILLTALVQSFAPWTGKKALLVDLEGHGREELFNDMDLSRTVGWFTTLFPVFLNLDEIDQPGTAIKSIKEQLRRIPQGGIGYGLLRYLHQNSQSCRQLQALPQAEVSFNYLGQFDQVLSQHSSIRITEESNGPVCSQKTKRKYLIEVNGLIISGKLQLEWIYSQKIHQRATIERLAQAYVEQLQALIAHCQSPDAGGYTLSDFPLAKLDEEKFNKISSLLD